MSKGADGSVNEGRREKESDWMEVKCGCVETGESVRNPSVYSTVLFWAAAGAVAGVYSGGWSTKTVIAAACVCVIVNLSIKIEEIIEIISSLDDGEVFSTFFEHRFRSDTLNEDWLRFTQHWFLPRSLSVIEWVSGWMYCFTVRCRVRGRHGTTTICLLISERSWIRYR